MSHEGIGAITKKQKEHFLAAYEKSLGNISRSCKTAKFGRTSFYNLCKNDKEFNAAVEELNGATGDFVESKLVSRINKNDTIATIFYCKTKLKHRGYIETIKNELSGDPDNPIHTAHTIDTTKLTLEQMLAFKKATEPDATD